MQDFLRPSVSYAKQRSISVLLPTYCEAQNIEIIIRRIQQLNLNVMITVIDDSSPDGTANIVEKLREEYGNLCLISRPKRFGLGSALSAGFWHVINSKEVPDYIVTLDADCSHDPRDIPKLVNAAGKGYDLVIGSRYCRGGEVVGSRWYRMFMSRLANLMAGIAIGNDTHDFTSGFRCYSTNCVQNALRNLRSQTYVIQMESVRQAKLNRYKVGEIPIKFVNRKKGKSKFSYNEIGNFTMYIIRIMVSRLFGFRLVTRE